MSMPKNFAPFKETFFQCNGHQSNTRTICTKYHEKILKGSQEKEKHKLKQLFQKYTKMAPNPEVNDVNKRFQCSDHQSSATNIYTKFYEKMSNDSQETEEHILEWGPWGHGK